MKKQSGLLPASLHTEKLVASGLKCKKPKMQILEEKVGDYILNIPTEYTKGYLHNDK